MVVLLIHPAPDPQHNGHVRRHEQVEPEGGHRGLDDDLAEIADEQVDRVQEEEALGRVAVPVDGVEDGGHVHQQLGEDRPQVLNVPEEDKQGRQDQAHADVEQHQTGDGVQKADQLPGEGDVVQDTEDEEHTQGQTEVDEGLYVFGEQEQVFGDVDLGVDPGVAHEGGHALPGRLVEVGEDQVAAEQIGGVVGRAASEELRKD